MYHIIINGDVPDRPNWIKKGNVYKVFGVTSKGFILCHEKAKEKRFCVVSMTYCNYWEDGADNIYED